MAEVPDLSQHAKQDPEKVAPQIERNPFTADGENAPLLSSDQEQTWLTQQHYEPVQRGTYHSAEHKKFYYHKVGFEVESQEKAQDVLILLRAMTQKGIFHPQTEWGLVANNNGQEVTVVARMPELQVIKPEMIETPRSERPPHLQQFMDRATANKLYGPAFDKADYASQLVENDTHLQAWVKRLNPSFSPTSIEESDLLTTQVLNIDEATEYDNWGFDPETKILYPVDLEVVKPLLRSEADWPKIAQLLVDAHHTKPASEI